MATEFLTKVTMPMNDQGVRVELFKLIELPTTPRVTDDVYMPGGLYIHVTKVRYRSDLRVELHFDDVWAAVGWNGSEIPNLIATLEGGGYSSENPWA